jgi:hypothetical protein
MPFVAISLKRDSYILKAISTFNLFTDLPKSSLDKRNKVKLSRGQSSGRAGRESSGRDDMHTNIFNLSFSKISD